MSQRFFPRMRFLTLIGSTLLALNCSSGENNNTGTAGTSGAGTAGTQGSAGTQGGGAGTQGGNAGTQGGGAGTQGGNAGTQGGNAGTQGGGAGTGAAGTQGGGAGTGAAGTQGGGAGTGAAGTGAVVNTGQSVLTRNKSETRDGHFVQPTLTKAMAAKMAPDTAFNTAAKFTGNMWAAPLYLENGPGGVGVFFAMTTNNNVYAINETTGATVWMHSIGPAPNGSGAGCGNINPTGIISTGVIDAAKRTIYVAGGVGNGNAIMTHEIHALDVDTGAEKAGWPVNASLVKGNGTLNFNTVAQNQRSALSLVNGILYVAYGGHIGDCNSYRGFVVAVNTANPTQVGAWATSGIGEAIWAAGGMASDGDGVFAATGNRTQGDSATHADSEEVVHVTGMGTVNRTTGIYYPAHWRQMDQQDADFGSVNPLIINVGGTKYVAAAAKDGHLYLLNPANLGGMGGHVNDFQISTGGAMAVKTTPAAFPSGGGVRIVMNAAGAVCASGNGNIVSAVISGSPAKAAAGWCVNGGNASPIATSTNGTAETMVWYWNNGLKGVDGDTGASIYNGNGGCGGVRQWSSPIAVKGRIIVGGDGNLCSWSPH
jgi:hypothetical protein